MSKSSLSLFRVILAGAFILGCMPLTALANTEVEAQDSGPSSSEPIDAVGKGADAEGAVQPSAEVAEGADAPSSIEEGATPTEAGAQDIAPLNVDPLALTVAYDAPIKCGAPTKFIINATGGSGNYKYMFDTIWLTSDDYYYVKDPSQGAGYVASNVFEFTFMVSGTYTLEFSVMDVDPGSLATQRQRLQVVVNDPSHPSAAAIASQVVAECTAAGNTTDYQKALWLHDWLLDHCQYDYSYTYCNAEGALARGTGTCEAYHRAYAMLLKRAGVEFGRVEGGGHVWTAVKMDGKWYQVDVTHDDIDYKPQAQFPEEQHLHFGLNDSLMEILNPGRKNVSQYPSTSLEDNYLVQSGAIKKYSDPNRAAIQQKLDAGERSFTLSPANADWVVSLQTAKQVVNAIVAYDLGSSAWPTNGKNAKLTVGYADDVFTIEAVVDGEIDSLTFYPGLHTLTGALRYGKSNGKYAQNEWVTINGRVYYFKDDGVAAKYYNDIAGRTYLFWSDCTLARNQIYNHNHFDVNGVMSKSKWIDFNGRRYYAKADGQLAQYATQIGNGSYLFWSDHSLARNQIYNHAHYDVNGVMSKSKWIDFNGRRYYAKEDGQLAQYFTDIAGKSYLFWSDHSLARNQVYDHRLYGNTGAMVKSGWANLNNRTYYAYPDGHLAQYATDIGGKSYLFWSDHSLARGTWWQGHYYGSDGVMATQRSINGRTYWVDGSGSWLANIPAKDGWQNPRQYYQVSSYSVMLPPRAYGSAHCYVTPSSIGLNATKQECIEVMIKRAYDYMGTSYGWGWSNEPGTAVDCSGLVIQCLYAAGMATPYDSWRQFYDANLITTDAMLTDPHFLKVSLSQRQRGDLIFYKGHVAIYLGSDRVIEATPPRVVESSMWRNTPIAVIRPFI